MFGNLNHISNLMSAKILLLTLLSIISSSFLLAADVNIVKLQTEYATKPLGIDVARPRFSWQMASVSAGAHQKAYQIIVVDEAKSKVWDSGKKVSGVSLNIKYNGKPLKPQSRYYWQIVVWGQDHKKHIANSWFETGLMDSSSSLSAWEGAKWVGGGDEDMPFYASYLPVFKISFTLQLDEATSSNRAGFIFGANDDRLMDKNKNVFALQSVKDSSYVMIELDNSPLVNNQPAQLRIYRRGYSPNDKKNTPLKIFSIPDSLINLKNQYQKHYIYFSTVLGDTKIYIGGDTKTKLIGSLNLNPMGAGGDHIAFPVVGNIGFCVPKKQVASFSQVQIRNFRNPSNQLYSAYAIPYKLDGKTKEIFQTIDPSKNSMPLLRRTFTVNKAKIAKARLYVTSRGIYQMYINGKRLGYDYFNPGATQYNKTLLYQTYDVTTQLKKGKNAIGAMLGEGWWSGASTFLGDYWNFFGDRQSLLTKLVITYQDGKKEIVVSEPTQWKYFNDGPLVHGSFFQGEVYDATKEGAVIGWNKPEFDDRKWKPCKEVLLVGNINSDQPADPILNVSDHSQLKLIGQFGTTIQKIKELTAIGVEEIRPGVFIYDMGQNMAGIPKISLKGLKSGKKIYLRFAEVKYPELASYKDNKGMIMLENIRAAMSQEIYITRGGEEEINPRFTYHGYRYVEITGIPKALPLNAVKGEVLSSIHKLSANYESSNAKINKLWENITWSSFANFMSIPTDCPQRNERLGWSGDISIFSNTATYLAAIPQFLRRHMLAMRDIQREDGRFPDVAPLGMGFGETLWGSAGITVAWESYQQYNDQELLLEHYPAMKKYIEYLIRDINPETNILKEKERGNWGSLGDWLSLEDARNEKTLFWEAYLIYDLELMSKMAKVVGNNEDAVRFSKLATERKIFFNETYIEQGTGRTAFRGKLIDTQTSYVLPLAFDIIDVANKTAFETSFANTITRSNITDQKVNVPPYSLMTGFIGTAWINKALSIVNKTDLAYRLLQQPTYPSWIYPIDQGATTIWERLNSYTHTDGFGGNNNMNSFNHYSFGAIGGWMFANSLGIQRDEASPGFKHFVLKPEPDPTRKMTYAKGYYDSMYGRIKSSWEITNDGCRYSFVVPANTSATFYLKTANWKAVLVNGKSISVANGIKYVGQESGSTIFELNSGTFNIIANP